MRFLCRKCGTHHSKFEQISASNQNKKACDSYNFLHLVKSRWILPLKYLLKSFQEGLSAMLTPYLSKQLSTNTPHETLKLLNSNSENPYLVWNNGTRWVQCFKIRVTNPNPQQSGSGNK